MKALFSTFVTLFICVQSFAQLWEVENAKLRVCWWSFGINGISEYINLGDTLINNEKYANIKVNEVQYSFMNPLNPYYNSFFMPMVRRNDSLLYRNTELNQDVLILVYNLQPGQSFDMSDNLIIDTCQTLDLTINIDSSYTFNFQGNNFRRYYTSQIQDPAKESMQFRYDLNEGYPISSQFNIQGSKLVGMFDDLVGTCDYQLLRCNATCFVDECPIVYDYQYYQNGDSLRPNSRICESYILKTLEVNQEKSINIYPNPCDKILHINGNNSEITIYNLQGKLIKTITCRNYNETTVIDVSNLPTGIYFVKELNGKSQLLRIEH